MLTDDFLAPYIGLERTGGNPLEGSFNGLGYVVYKRTYARPIEADNRTEEWYETVARVVNGAGEIGARLTDEEAQRLFDHIWSLRASVSGRALWQLGTENNKRLGGDSLVNCWFVDISTIDDIVWMFERLMLGGGVGFSVTRSAELGTVVGGRVTHSDQPDADFIVPDTRRGWAEVLYRTLKCCIRGGVFTYSTQLVRPEGAPISTFGGIASGPGILNEGLEAVQEIINGAVGRELTSVELLDICNLVGTIVVSGNVRRSAQIALGSPDDNAFLEAKRWEDGIPSHRAMSNNSVYLQDWSELGESFWNNYSGSGEPYGIVNLYRTRRNGRLGEYLPDPTVQGFNPCGEIGLGHRESCNLAELVLPKFKSYEELEDAAILLYKVQKAIANLPYLDARSQRITKANQRLGLSITGVFMASREQLDWLDPLYRSLRAFDKEWSERNGYFESVRLTTVQPSGTKSLLFGVTPGAHPGFSRFHIRRVRMASNDPVFDYVKERGYPWEFQRDFEGNENHRIVVVEFPCEFPYGILSADHVTWKDMLKMQEFLQTAWADNAVSITVYYELEDLPEIKEYMEANWHKFKSVSFLLKDGHGFDQAPLEAISIPEYERRLDELNLEHNIQVEGVGDTMLLDSDCEGGACPIR